MTNSELRKRKNKQHNDRPKKGPSKKKKEAGISMHVSLLCLILSGTIFTVFIILYTDQLPWFMAHRAVDSFAKKFLGSHKPVYAVVMDAGSTGSRVLAYSFHESYFGNHLILDKELFEYTKPGLSSFAKEPKNGAQTIAKLLEHAKQEIPDEYWSKTPLVLKATAGLRMLPLHQAEKLLESVKDVFKTMPFLTNENAVEIMDGTDEGVFSWFTVNFLLERLSGDPANSVAALDLGGGSTQVTFAAMTPASLKESDYIQQVASPRGSIPVYTNSFAGLGLMAARHAMITINQPDTMNVTSECVNPIIKKKKFLYHGKKYFVSGLQENYPTSKVRGTNTQIGETVPIVSFQDCSKLITEYVKSKASPPHELPLKTIFAFSYYFDRATEAGLIDEATGGNILIKDFKGAAEKACHEANAEQPFMCLDLTFIWSLLEHGFGLKPETKIFLHKKINGHEISWALGAAYEVLRGKQTVR
ncbi:nucleoside diphosphate phosphatase ENTPD5 isoform X1 [Diabrotica virgifera virgifera]|uniref:Ectonucleoside triphosphate diphosphohydrolase 5 n=1 Tax=Diabrotica virgifera virgifera TaxID=50390 RepID=A0ABM5KR43_DIAVI|nr:nucleoside diphosphate phosphatase ENTPD5 isoform X1 [Diabrotica virgifera virgifera]